MAHSLEIRLPLVDVELFRCVARLSAVEPLAKADVACLPEKPLPGFLLNRRKTGFSIPVRDWLEGNKSAVGPSRGLKSWALKVNEPPPKRRRYLTLLTDAFGGIGGIAKFNRDFLHALSTFRNCDEVIAIPRLIPAPMEPLPLRLRYVTSAVDSKFKYLLTVARVLAERKPLDFVVCCHLNLLPVAWIAGALAGCRVVLIIHGIDAWKPTKNVMINFLAARIDEFIAVSKVTKDRFVAWTGLDPEKGMILPNSVDLDVFRPGPKSSRLLEKHGLQGKSVLMTVGRLVSEERYKGFDEIIELLPALSRMEPSIVYVIVGEGNDRRRLEAKARDIGVSDRVLFAGFVPEGEKCDYYNLADAYVMPSRGEGFGIVFLEAMSCGVPAIGSIADGSREALLNGKLGALVDPDDAEGIARAVLDALKRPKQVPPGLDYFSIGNFDSRVHQIMNAW
jgi:glycosyltransferase involved in cell wall biosynthesis